MKKAIHVAVTVLSIVILLSSCGTPEPPMKDTGSQQPAVGAQWYCADGSVYDLDTGKANVSRNWGDSFLSSLAIDSSGNPHIAWQDGSFGNGDILYTRWNGSEWVCADGTVYDPYTGNANVSRNSDRSRNPSLVIDSSDNPHITWSDGSYTYYSEILYTRWNGSDWVCADGSVYDPVADSNPANVSMNWGVSFSSSLAIDSSDNPHIAWSEDIYDEISETLYTRWNGSDWVCADGAVYDPATSNANVSRNSGDSWHPSLSLDFKDDPHIAWHDESYGNPEILYTWWNGSDWVCADGEVYVPGTGNANVSWSGSISDYPSLALDSSGNPHIAWQDGSFGNGEILYNRFNGSDWVCADGSFYDPEANPNSANVSRNSASSSSSSLAIDSSGNPHIAWWDESYGNPEILYTWWNGSDWVCADGEVYVPGTGNANVVRNSCDTFVDYSPSLALDSSGNPHITWHDNRYVNGEILYIHWKDGD